MPVEMKYDTTLAEQAYALAARWDSAREISISELSFKPDDLASFNGNQTGTYVCNPEVHSKT